MIDLRQISKTYQRGREQTPVLRNVDLHVARGEFVAMVGPSGSGKSTLMHIIGCLDRAFEGQYCLSGQDVSALNERDLAALRRDMIGFVFQGYQLLPHLSALDNTALSLTLLGVPKRERQARAREALQRVGLLDRCMHLPSALSGGQQQRVAVARALVHRPPVILADEPTGNLDQAATQDVLALIDALHKEGRTVVLITHDEAVAARAQRRLYVDGGRVTQQQDAPPYRAFGSNLSAVQPHRQQR